MANARPTGINPPSDTWTGGGTTAKQSDYHNRAAAVTANLHRACPSIVREALDVLADFVVNQPPRPGKDSKPAADALNAVVARLNALLN
ncbi:MAG: hypothetical protein GJU76_05260 [Gallionella sp.]|jgi:hypothetical protein|nr:hypothetical protein [Gallionella sp.]